MALADVLSLMIIAARGKRLSKSWKFFTNPRRHFFGFQTSFQYNWIEFPQLHRIPSPVLTALDWEFYATLSTSELKTTESYIMLCSIFHLLLLYLKSINNGFKWRRCVRLPWRFPMAMAFLTELFTSVFFGFKTFINFPWSWKENETK